MRQVDKKELREVFIMTYWFSNNATEFHYEYSAAGLFMLVVDKYGEQLARYAFASKEDALDALWAGEVEF